MRKACPQDEWRVVPLAPECVTVFKSPDPERVSIAHPSVMVLKSGRAIVSADLSGPGVKKLSGIKGRRYQSNHWVQGRMFVSDEGGESWSGLTEFPFCGASLFRDGTSIYALGHAGNLRIMRSYDGGSTWSKPEDLTPADDSGAFYVRGPGSVLAHEGNIYMAFMWLTDQQRKGEAADALAPVIIRARAGSVLTKASAWTVSSPVKSFREVVPEDGLDFSGMPFLGRQAGRSGKRGGRRPPALGWHQAHVVPVVADGPPGCFGKRCLLAAVRTHRGGYAALATVDESPGKLTVELVRAPSGKTWVFLPVPVGGAEFDILYDAESALYWLLGEQAVDSMAYARRKGQGAPRDEHRRLQLHFSRNLVDWCFAGLVTVAAAPEVTFQQSRMAVRGKDLCIASCETDGDAPRLKHPDLLTLRIVRDFRSLAY